MNAFTTAGGNDIVLQAVPESSSLLTLVGGTLTGARFRRRRK